MFFTFVLGSSRNLAFSRIAESANLIILEAVVNATDSVMGGATSKTGNPV